MTVKNYVMLVDKMGGRGIAMGGPDDRPFLKEVPPDQLWERVKNNYERKMAARQRVRDCQTPVSKRTRARRKLAKKLEEAA